MSKKNQQNQEADNNDNPYVYTVTTDTNKNKGTNDEGIIKKLLRKILTWQGLAAIAALISLGYVIWDHWDHDTKIEKLQKSNIELISQIRSTFKTDIPPVETDTLGEIDKIINFRKATLEYCSIYESLEKSNLTKENVTMESAIESFGLRMMRQNDLAKEMILNFGDLSEIAKANGSVEYLLFDTSIQKDIIKSLTAKNKLSEEAKEDIMKCLQTKDLEKALKIVQNMHDDYICLKADNDWFNFAIEANRILNMRLDKIK